MTEQQTSDLGVYAEQLLANPAFKAVFEHMRNTVQAAWRTADLRDLEGQRLLLQQAKIIDRVEESARGMVEAGKLADSRMRDDGLRAESRMASAARTVRKFF